MRKPNDYVCKSTFVAKVGFGWTIFQQVKNISLIFIYVIFRQFVVAVILQNN